MKKWMVVWVIWIVCAFVTTGCSKQSSSNYLQLILSSTEIDPTESYTFPSEIEKNIDHPFPFYIHAETIIPIHEKSIIMEVEECILSKDVVQRLLDYFSYGNLWKDVNGNALSPSQNGFSAFQDLDGMKAVFRVTRDNMFEYIKNYQVVVMREEYLEDSPELSQDFLEDPLISYEDALAIADKTIRDLDFIIDNNLTLCYGTKAVGYIGNNPMAYGWEFVFTRSCGGLQTPYRSEYDLWINSDPPVACAPWEKECLFIFVNETGVFRIDARGLGKEKRVWETDTHLLPYEEILQCIINQLKKQHPGPIDGGKTTDWKIEVKRIELCSVLLNDRNSSVGYMIPTWEVEYTLEYSIEGEHDLFTQYTYFNAIDGTYVEPRMTVHDAKNAYGLDN